MLQRASIALLALCVTACGSIEYGVDEPSAMHVQAAPQAAPARQISISVFVRELAPYGEWIEDGQNGRVFVPEDPDYRPYRNGRWVVDENGAMAWVSYDAIGWAVSHYGEWVILDDGRWAWIPGTEWSGGDVQWRSNDQYVGWAPQVVGAEPPVASWVFVEPSYLFSTYVPSYAIPYATVPAVYASCAPRSWASGPPRRWRQRHRVRGARVAVARPRGPGRVGRRPPRTQGADVRVLPRRGGRRVARGADVRVHPAGVGRSRAGLGGHGRWVPRETVVLGGEPVPDRRGPGGVVVMPESANPAPRAAAELHPVRPPVGSGTPSGLARAPTAARVAPPPRFVGPRPRFSAPPRAARPPQLAGPMMTAPSVTAPNVTAPSPRVAAPPAALPRVSAPRGPTIQRVAPHRMMVQPRAQPGYGVAQRRPAFAPRPRIATPQPRVAAPPRVASPRAFAPPRAAAQPRVVAPPRAARPRVAAPRRAPVQRAAPVQRRAAPVQRRAAPVQRRAPVMRRGASIGGRGAFVRRR